MTIYIKCGIFIQCNPIQQKIFKKLLITWMNLKNIVLKKMLGKRKQTKKNHIISDSIYMKYLEKTDW